MCGGGSYSSDGDIPQNDFTLLPLERKPFFWEPKIPFLTSRRDEALWRCASVADDIKGGMANDEEIRSNCGCYLVDLNGLFN